MHWTSLTQKQCLFASLGHHLLAEPLPISLHRSSSTPTPLCATLASCVCFHRCIFWGAMAMALGATSVTYYTSEFTTLIKKRFQSKKMRQPAAISEIEQWRPQLLSLALTRPISLPAPTSTPLPPFLSRAFWKGNCPLPLLTPFFFPLKPVIKSLCRCPLPVSSRYVVFSQRKWQCVLLSPEGNLNWLASLLL